MPITIPRATLDREWPRLSTRGALAAAPASIPNTAVRILRLIDTLIWAAEISRAIQETGINPEIWTFSARMNLSYFLPLYNLHYCTDGKSQGCCDLLIREVGQVK